MSPVIDALNQVSREHLSHFPFSSPTQIIMAIFEILYILVQTVISWLFKPPLPRHKQKSTKKRGRIAVIGAGLTGISSAAHAISHGFDVVIFESQDKVGGIWANVNFTSGLQLNSLLYRFHPALLWRKSFPQRDEILGEISRIWKEYELESRTQFKNPVTSVRRADPHDFQDSDPSSLGHSRWIINDGKEGIFDAIIATVGTCGEPLWIPLEGMPKHISARDGDSKTKDESENDADRKADDHDTFKGTILHSSQLDTVARDELKRKSVVIIGSGASGVEAAETALSRGADNCVMLARDDKWIIPRNIVVDTLISMQPFGREMPLSFLWEYFLRKWHYHGVEDLVPASKGLFESTPIVNDEFLEHVRRGSVEYVRGETKKLLKNGVRVNVRDRQSKSGDAGKEKEFRADVIVLATGFKLPSVDFLPKDLFPEDYQRPNLYLQNFSTEDWSILLTNAAYKNAIGTVGHFHIGIYTRILLVLLMDRNARPLPKDMKLWVDVIRFAKRGAKGGALSFFTYMELTIWLILFHIFRPDRIRWLFFIMQGWGFSS